MARRKNVGGRPPVLTGMNRHRALQSIKARGLTKTQERLADKGIVVSMGTLHNLAKSEKIKLTQGRPSLKKAA